MEDRSIPDAVVPADDSGRLRVLSTDVHYYDHLIDSVSDAIISFSPDITIKSWNRAAEMTYGWPAAQAVGRNAFELLRATFPGSSFRERYGQLMEKGRLEFEMVHTARDGRRITMLSNMALLRDEDGKTKGCVAVMRDITERKNAEDIVRKSNESTEILYEVVEKLLEGDRVQSIIREICMRVMRFLDCDMFINYLVARDNPGALRLNAWCGLEEGDAAAIGTIARGQRICGCVADTCARIVVEDVQHSADERVALVKSRGIRAYACHPLTVKDEVLGTLAFGSSAKDSFDAGELALMRAVCGHVAVAVNRMRTESDLKELAEELREKNKLITDFFTNISHEFKTPLSIILVDLQLMEYRLRDAGGKTQEKLGKMIAVVRQNALRLLRLIGNLLDVTKIDAGFMKTRLVNTDIVALISGLVESVCDYAGNAGISIGFRSDRKARIMPVDSEKMERVMLNLLSNAIKHTPEGGHIAVEMRHAEGGVTVCVTDDGEGIPDDKKELIFDRFRQVNTSLTRSSEGCGIGLSLTKALVELLRGRIWFESRLGRGSEFFVELPVLAENENAHTLEVEGMPRSRKVEMEFSDIHKTGRQI